MSEEIVLAIGMPRRDNLASHAALLGLLNPVSRPTRVLSLELGPCSLLNHGFNRHWAAALNARDEIGATHFAMIHSDVCPEYGWATVLLDELIERDADVVSAVIPIKDERGLTTTAVYDGDPFVLRRLTLTEIAQLPVTFSEADTSRKLLLNTGLWVCDLRKPWVDGWCFCSKERIVTNDKGRKVAEVSSEDWQFSHYLNEQGAKIYATSKVKVLHEGGTQFGNGEPWGAWTEDKDSTLPPKAGDYGRKVAEFLLQSARDLARARENDTLDEFRRDYLGANGKCKELWKGATQICGEEERFIAIDKANEARRYLESCFELEAV
jgi:hypothetical protein